MQKDFEFTLDSKVAEDLDIYTKLLKKDHSTILNEALELYFESEQKKLLEKNLENENAMTNLDYDEFWDGVDV